MYESAELQYCPEQKTFVHDPPQEWNPNELLEVTFEKPAWRAACATPPDGLQPSELLTPSDLYFVRHSPYPLFCPVN